VHADELPIDADMARDLIGTQFPRWRGQTVRRVTSSGTVNAIFRLGDRFAARFPLRGVMSHGDLTPGNVLIADGHLAGVLDVEDYRAADPALDLISAWNLFEAEPRQVLRRALRCTDLEWERSKAWAFQQAMGLVWYYQDSNPVMSRLGRTTLDRIMAATEILSDHAAYRWNVSGCWHRTRRSLERVRVRFAPGIPVWWWCRGVRSGTA
jgi:aminoglycoside phosphotransferase (APT) family kinase protein